MSTLASRAHADGNANPTSIELGLAIRELALPHSTAAARTVSPVPEGPARVQANVFIERLGLRLGPLYAALEIDFGHVACTDCPTASSLLVDAFLVGGARARLGPFAITGELDGGKRFATYATSLRDQAALLEARARVELWNRDGLAIGPMVGAGLLANEWIFGVMLGVHGPQRRSTPAVTPPPAREP